MPSSPIIEDLLEADKAVLAALQGDNDDEEIENQLRARLSSNGVINESLTTDGSSNRKNFLEHSYKLIKTQNQNLRVGSHKPIKRRDSDFGDIRMRLLFSLQAQIDLLVDCLAAGTNNKDVEAVISREEAKFWSDSITIISKDDLQSFASIDALDADTGNSKETSNDQGSENNSLSSIVNVEGDVVSSTDAKSEETSQTSLVQDKNELNVADLGKKITEFHVNDIEEPDDKDEPVLVEGDGQFKSVQSKTDIPEKQEKEEVSHSVDHPLQGAFAVEHDHTGLRDEPTNHESNSTKIANTSPIRSTKRSSEGSSKRSKPRETPLLSLVEDTHMYHFHSDDGRMAFQYWMQDKDRSRQPNTSKAQRMKEQEEQAEKIRDAEMAFISWKQMKDEELEEQKAKMAKIKKNRKLKTQENEERMKDARIAFEAWDKAKKKELAQHRKQMRLMAEAAADYNHVDGGGEYAAWLRKKREESQRRKQEKRVMAQLLQEQQMTEKEMERERKRNFRKWCATKSQEKKTKLKDERRKVRTELSQARLLLQKTSSHSQGQTLDELKPRRKPSSKSVRREMRAREVTSYLSLAKTTPR